MRRSFEDNVIGSILILPGLYHFLSQGFKSTKIYFNGKFILEFLRLG